MSTSNKCFFQRLFLSLYVFMGKQKSIFLNNKKSFFFQFSISIVHFYFQWTFHLYKNLIQLWNISRMQHKTNFADTKLKISTTTKVTRQKKCWQLCFILPFEIVLQQSFTACIVLQQFTVLRFVQAFYFENCNLLLFCTTQTFLLQNFFSFF